MLDHGRDNRTKLRAWLDTSGRSMRALSLQAGLNAKAVSDYLTRGRLRPDRKTLDALERETGLLLEDEDWHSETYADLIERLRRGVASEGDRKAASRAISRVRWYLRKTDRVAELELVDRARMLAFFAGTTPTMVGLSKGSLATYKSELLDIIATAVTGGRKRSIRDLSGPLRDLHRMIIDSDVKHDMKMIAGSFCVFLQDQGLSPRDVTPAVMTDYFAVRMVCSKKDERTCIKHVKRTCALVSTLAAHPEFSGFGFKPIAHPFVNKTDKFNVAAGMFDALMTEFDTRVAPWAQGQMSSAGETLAEVLADLDREQGTRAPAGNARLLAFVGRAMTKETKTRLQRMTERGFVHPKRRWKDKTLAVRRGYVLAAAKAVFAATGHQITSITDLTDPLAANAAAIALVEANTGSDYSSGYVASILKMICKLAEGYVHRSEEDISELRALTASHKTEGSGIAPRNRDKLKQFTERRIQTFVDLSETIVADVNALISERREAKYRETGRRPARIALHDTETICDLMCALAHDILLVRAPRSSNVTEIELEWVRWREGLATIEIPGQEVKFGKATDAPLAIPLGSAQSRRLLVYLEKLRPIIVETRSTPNPYLFPSPDPRPEYEGMPYQTLLARLCRRVARDVGAKINPHLYRHLIGWIWLRRDVSKLPAVQKLLKHKSLQTTLDFYAEIDESLALQEWQDFLNDEKKRNRD